MACFISREKTDEAKKKSKSKDDFYSHDFPARRLPNVILSLRFVMAMNGIQALPPPTAKSTDCSSPPAKQAKAGIIQKALANIAEQKSRKRKSEEQESDDDDDEEEEEEEEDAEDSDGEADTDYVDSGYESNEGDESGESDASDGEDNNDNTQLSPGGEAQPLILNIGDDEKTPPKKKKVTAPAEGGKKKQKKSESKSGAKKRKTA